MTGPSPGRSLAEELESFGRRSRNLRTVLPRGSLMPAAQVDAWWGVLARVDAWRASQGGSAASMARVYRLLRAELQADAHAYAEVPDAVGERARASLELLAAHLPRRQSPRRARGSVVSAGPLLLSWPLSTSAITSAYGPRLHPIHGELRMHAGVDLAARMHQPVLAAAKGRVERVGWNGAHGLQVEVVHSGGLRTRYSHLSQATVDEGEELGRGDVLGLAGRTGRTTGVHLHFEVWRNGEPLDPIELLEDGSEESGGLTVSQHWPQ